MADTFGRFNGNILTVHLNPPPADGREARKRIEAVAAENYYRPYGAAGKPYRTRNETHSYMIAADEV